MSNNIYHIIIRGVKPQWRKLIECNNDVYLSLKNAVDKLLENDIKYSPSMCNILQWAKYSDLNQIKIVILGIKPCSLIEHADGLAYSSKSSKCPENLNIIYQCLQQTKIIKEKPQIYTLTNWAKQGVLLLNISLTTDINNNKNTHFIIWRKFIDNIIKNISLIDKKIIWMLWGNLAQSKLKLINNNKHIIYKSSYPSLYIQNKIQNPINKFINCTHFIDTDILLNEESIIWDPVIKHVIYTDGSANLRLDKNNKKAHNKSIAGWAYFISKGPFKYSKNSGIVKIKEKVKIVDKENLNSIYTAYPTAPRAEGIAIIKALEFIINHKIKYEGIIILKTDCLYWYNIMNIYKWIDSNINIDNKKNRDIIEQLKKLNLIITRDIGKLKILYINASHNIKYKPNENNKIAYIDYIGNNIVDAMAKKIIYDILKK